MIIRNEGPDGGGTGDEGGSCPFWPSERVRVELGAEPVDGSTPGGPALPAGLPNFNTTDLLGQKIPSWGAVL